MRPGPAALGMLLAILPDVAAGQQLSVDLADPDPGRLAELPGITSEEVALLREMAGLDPEALWEREASRSIPRERWLAWLPYLRQSDAGFGSLRTRIRGRMERSAAGALRDLLEVGLRGSSWGVQLRCRGTLDPRSRSQAAHADGEARVRPSRSVTVLLGSISPSLAGPDPWDDPLGGSWPAPPIVPAPGVGSRSGARGGALRVGPVLAAGSTRAGRGTMLLAAGGSTHELFWGRSQGRGEGWGARVRWKRLSMAIAFHRPSAAPPAVRWVALRGQTAITSAWSLHEAPGRRTTRFDAMQLVQGRDLALRLSASAGAGGSTRPIDVAFRVRVHASDPQRRLGEILVAGGRLRADLAWGAGGSPSCLEIRSRFERSRGAEDGAVVLEGGVGWRSSRVEVALLARTDRRLDWPLPDASELRATSGVRAGGRIALSRGWLSIRALAPLAAGESVLRKMALRVEIEREAGP